MKTIVDFGGNVDGLVKELKQRGIKSVRLQGFHGESYPRDLGQERGQDFGVLVTAIGEEGGMQILYRSLRHVGNIAVGEDKIASLLSEQTGAILRGVKDMLGGFVIEQGWYALA